MEGYEFKTTFWEDFSIADRFGVNAVKDTYRRAFREWSDDAEYVTELALVLNWKCWKHYEEGRMELSKLYSDLYYECNAWCLEHLNGDDAKYYFEVTD